MEAAPPLPSLPHTGLSPHSTANLRGSGGLATLLRSPRRSGEPGGVRGQPATQLPPRGAWTPTARRPLTARLTASTPRGLGAPGSRAPAGRAHEHPARRAAWGGALNVYLLPGHRGLAPSLGASPGSPSAQAGVRASLPGSARLAGPLRLERRRRRLLVPGSPASRWGA